MGFDTFLYVCYLFVFYRIPTCEMQGDVVEIAGAI